MKKLRTFINDILMRFWDILIYLYNFLSGYLERKNNTPEQITPSSVYEHNNEFESNLQKQYHNFLSHSLDNSSFECLLLSGGGSHGAYGAGYIAGWRDTKKMPKFRLVTGVSTGALQATWVFLGKNEDFDQMTRVYTNVQTKDIYRLRNVLDGSVNSAYITEGLSNIIRENISYDTIKRVEEESKKGRKLYVGSTNLDTGNFHAWDMTALASDPNMTLDQKRDRYCLILMASSAIPIAFPPVIVDGAMHVDGGAIANTFVYESMVHVKDMMGKEGKDRFTVNVIVNGYRGLYTTCVRNDLFDIATRSLKILFNANEEADLKVAEYLSASHKLKFNITNLPDDFKTSMTPIEFIPEEMRKMYLRGYEEGVKNKWSKN